MYAAPWLVAAGVGPCGVATDPHPCPLLPAPPPSTGQLKFDKATGCAYDPSKQGVAPGPLPLTLSQLATLLGTDVGTLQRLNPGKGLQAQTEVLRSSGSGKGVASSLGPISIPCPGVA